MKFRFGSTRIIAFLGLILALACQPPDARAFFWGGNAKNLLREADYAVEIGRQAEDEQRIMDACDAYSRAHELYIKLAKEHPKHQPEHVKQQNSVCRVRLRTLFAKAASGAVDVPPPEEVLAAASGQTFPVEANVETSAADPAPSSTPEPQEAETEDQQIAPQHSDFDPTLIEVDSKSPATNSQPSKLIGLLFPNDEIELPKVDTTPTSQDEALSRMIQNMLEEGAGADAVLMLERIVENPDIPATFTQKLLLVQALMSRHNYARAERILMPLVEAQPDNPACIMLGSGLHLARGKPFEALRLLDQFVAKFPRYADAYVNLAYTRFAMDPDKNRNEAVKYYHHALLLGAQRDPRLELELRVSVSQ